jgi:hypothetical protein
MSKDTQFDARQLLGRGNYPLLPHYVNSCSLLLWCIIIHVSFHFRVILFSLPLCLIKALDSNLGI